MSPWLLLALQLMPILLLAGVMFYLGRRAQLAQKELIDRIRARYPKWIISFNSDGSTTKYQVNSKEEHEALEARLKS